MQAKNVITRSEREQKYSEAVQQYIKAAEQGNVDAMYRIAYINGYGLNGWKNPDQAFKWYQNGG